MVDLDEIRYKEGWKVDRIMVKCRTNGRLRWDKVEGRMKSRQNNGKM